MDYAEIWRVVNDVNANCNRVDGKIIELETLVKNSLASREWVSAELRQIRDAATRTETAIETMSRQVGELANDVKGVYQTQDRLLKERAEQERLEHEARLASLQEQTFLNVLKNRWAPIGSFILIGAGLIALVGKLLEHWMLQYVAHIAK